MSYQPVLHGVPPQFMPLRPSGGSDRYTSAPVSGLACIEMSGRPRWSAGMGVLPAGRTLCQLGRANTSLKPPPVPMPRAVSPQATSSCVVAWHTAGGLTWSATRPAFWPTSALVQSDVPPTAVTNGSDAGQPTVAPSSVVPPLATGVFLSLAEPVSPVEATIVTPLASAALKASRRFSSDCLLPKAPSAVPKDCEMTSARWCSTTYFSAAIICGSPCTPSVSAVGVWTSRMFAPGAIACAISTSSATSSAQALLSSWPVPLLFDGGAFVAGEPCSESSLYFGMPGWHVTPSSPHRCARPKALLNTCRSWAMVSLP